MGVLETFFKGHCSAVIEHTFCYMRFVCFLYHELGCQQVLTGDNPAIVELKRSLLWMYFSRDRDLGNASWMRPVRGLNTRIQVLPHDAQFAEESLNILPQ